MSEYEKPVPFDKDRHLTKDTRPANVVPSDLRDYFAGQALLMGAVLLMHRGDTELATKEAISEMAYIIADAMLVERAR